MFYWIRTLYQPLIVAVVWSEILAGFIGNYANILSEKEKD